MSNDYWLTCNSCTHEWIGQPFRTDGTSEKCPECGGDDFEVGSMYRPFSIREAFWIVLLIPNFLLFLN